MANRLKVLLLIVGVLTISFGVVDSQARRKHRHSVKTRYFVGSKTLPAGDDPSTSGVESLAIRCPRGYRITGGGYDMGTIAIVPTARFEADGRGYGVIGVNQVDQSSTMRVTIACIRRRTTATRALAGPSLRSEVERLRAQRRRD